MLGYIYGHDELVADFVAQLIPECRERGFSKASKAIGVVNGDGHLIGGVVYHNWDPDAAVIEMSAAALPGSGWLTRETLRRIYQYPFHQVGCQMVIKRVAADNERMLRIFAAYGCMFIKVPRMLGRERDGVLVLLTFEDWANNKFNQRLGHHFKPELLSEAA